MHERELQHMYQAWCQDNTNAGHDWYIFVQKAARHSGKDETDIMRELQKYRWFEWTREE